MGRALLDYSIQRMIKSFGYETIQHSLSGLREAALIKKDLTSDLFELQGLQHRLPP